MHRHVPIAGLGAASAHLGRLPTLRWARQDHHVPGISVCPPWSACGPPWVASPPWAQVGITCTTTVSVRAIHSSLQPSVLSHGGSCPGVTTVLSTLTPQRPTDMTTVAIVCVTFHRGRCVHPHRPPAAPACPLHVCGFTVEFTGSTMVERCTREPRCHVEPNYSGYASRPLCLQPGSPMPLWLAASHVHGAVQVVFTVHRHVPIVRLAAPAFHHGRLQTLQWSQERPSCSGAQTLLTEVCARAAMVCFTSVGPQWSLAQPWCRYIQSTATCKTECQATVAPVPVRPRCCARGPHCVPPPDHGGN